MHVAAGFGRMDRRFSLRRHESQHSDEWWKAFAGNDVEESTAAATTIRQLFN